MRQILVNLDENFTLLGKKPNWEYKSFYFSAGECYIKFPWIISDDAKVLITQRIQSGNDIMKILLAIDAIKRFSFVKEIELFIPYLFYSRQDRICNEGESFSLKVFADILNSLKLSTIYTYDVHSIVSEALINNLKVISPEHFIINTIQHIGSPVYLICPDAGATKKLNTLYNKQGNNLFTDIVYCTKHRSVSDGHIDKISVHYDTFNPDIPCLIVDDICDGGATFIALAKELINKGVGNIYLFVSHGIFSKGFDELNLYFKKIYTTNSILQKTNYPYVFNLTL